MTSPWLKNAPQTEGFSRTRVKDFTMAEENFEIISSKMPPDGRISRIRVNDFPTVEENFEIHCSEEIPLIEGISRIRVKLTPC